MPRPKIEHLSAREDATIATRALIFGGELQQPSLGE